MIGLFGTRKKLAGQAVLPAAAYQELLRHHPQLTSDQAELVTEGLRQWYRVVQLVGNRPLAMPSRVVDDLWHAHITCTRDYAGFCLRAFGRFLHHHPESMMDPAAAARNGGAHLRRTLEVSRQIEGTDGLPLLFRIDAELEVTGARHFVLACGVGPCAPGPVTCLAHLPRVIPRQRNGRSAGCATGGTGGGWGVVGGSGDGGGGGGCGGGCGA